MTKLEKGSRLKEEIIYEVLGWSPDKVSALAGNVICCSRCPAKVFCNSEKAKGNFDCQMILSEWINKED